MTYRIICPSRLGLAQIEGVLAQTRNLRQDPRSGAWICSTRARSMQVDLRAVKFADVKALAALTIVVNVCAQEMEIVEILSPRSTKVASFVSYVRFIEALESAPGASYGVQSELIPSDDVTYDNVLPLTWVTERTNVNLFLKHVLLRRHDNSLAAQMLDVDAEALADVVLEELIDNVSMHSRTVGALITAWSPRRLSWISREDYTVDEREYYQNLSKGSPEQLHLYVADRGIGIPASLRSVEEYSTRRDIDLLDMSLDRWSSSVDRTHARGARGLYRVHRIASTYRGLLTVRSGAAIIGRDSSNDFNFSELAFERTTAAPLPGTHIRLELPLMTPVMPQAPQTVPPSAEVESITLTEEVAWKKESLWRILATPSDDKVLLIVVPRQIGSDREIARLLCDVSDLAHPKRVALVGFGCSDVELALACDAANTEIARLRAVDDQGDRFGPILVVGTSFKKYWQVGAKPDRTDEQLAEAATRVTSILSDLQTRSDRSLSTLAESIRQAALSELAELIQVSSRMGPAAGFVTSALSRTSRWIDVGTVCRSFKFGAEVLARLVTTKLEEDQPDLVAQHPSLVYESSIDDQLATAIARLLQASDPPPPNSLQKVRPHDIEVSRELSLNTQRPVVVLIGTVSSGNAARQLTSLVLRQGRRLTAIAGIVDMRSRDSGGLVELWNSTYRVACLYVLESGIAEDQAARRESRPMFLDQHGRKESRPRIASLAVATPRAIRLLGGADAILLGHFSGAVDRHFTFYIDAIKALENRAFCENIVSPLIAQIERFARLDRHGLVYMRYPSPEIRPDSPAQVLADMASEELKIRGVRIAGGLAIDRRLADQSVVQIAWGSVSGHSMLSTIDAYARVGVNRLLCMTVFAQLPFELEQHLSSLRRVEVLDHEMDVDVSFISRLPVSAFPQENCPVCRQLSSRGRWLQQHYRQDLQSEEMRLAVQLWQPGGDFPTTDPIAQMLSPGSARSMNHSALLRRGELIEAQRSTKSAFRYAQSLSRNIQKPGDWLEGLLCLLIYEPQWLRQPPLSNRECRTILTRQCMALVNSRLLPGFAREARGRALVALRSISKLQYSRWFPEIVTAVLDDDDLFDLAKYTLGTILAHDYLSNTDLPVLISASVSQAEDHIAAAQAGGANAKFYGRRMALAAARNRATELQTIGIRSSLAVWQLLDAFQKEFYDLGVHSIRDSLNKADPTNLEAEGLDVGHYLAAWRAVLSWLQSRFLPHIERFRRSLRLTFTLAESEAFNDLFSSVAGLEAVRRLIALGDELSGPSLRSELISRAPEVRKLYEEIRELFSPRRGQGLIISALVECKTTMGRLTALFAASCTAHDVVFAGDYARFEHTRLVIPSRFLHDLVENIVRNAVENHDVRLGRPIIHIDLDLSQVRSTDLQLSRLSIVTTNTRPQRRRASWSGPGGLTEMKSALPDYTQLDFGYRATTHEYVVDVECPVGWLEGT